MKILALLAVAFMTLGIYSPVSAQPSTETEEAQTLIKLAEVNLMICNDAKDRPFSTVAPYEKEECDHNVLFLKGICESTNNTAYDWCFNTDMVRYLNARDINNAPRPSDVWCNMFIDKCIIKYGALMKTAVDMTEEYDLSTGQDLIDTYDEMIQELKEKQGQQGDGQAQDNTDN